MSKDLRKEQIVLLRFEKQIAGLAALMATGGAVAAKAADGKLHATEASAAYAEVQTALVHLAEVTDKAHAALNSTAMEAGFDLLEAAGGVPKRTATSQVASILGIG